jgi:hypothetical protein
VPDLNNPELQSRILLTSFTDRIRRELESQAIEAIRPAVREAVDKVVEELRPIVETQFHDLANKMVVELVTREVKTHG